MSIVVVVKPFIKPAMKFIATTFGPETIKWTKNQVFKPAKTSADLEEEIRRVQLKKELAEKKAAMKVAELEAKAKIKEAEAKFKQAGRET